MYTCVGEEANELARSVSSAIESEEEVLQSLVGTGENNENFTKCFKIMAYILI